jgi:hypothetical protein
VIDTPPKAQHVRRIANEIVSRTLVDLGFRPTRSGRPGWLGELDGEAVGLYLQFSKWNHRASDDGYEFTVDVEVTGDRPIAGARLFELLTDEEREAHRQLQNLVIAKLPFDDEAVSRLPPLWQADRLVRVTPRFVPYRSGVDVWFRYLDEQDVRRWMEFIRQVLPGALRRLFVPAGSHDIPKR